MRWSVIARDWHGNLGHAISIVDRAATVGIDTVIQVGDFGFGCPGDDPRLLQRPANKNPVRDGRRSGQLVGPRRRSFATHPSKQAEG